MTKKPKPVIFKKKQKLKLCPAESRLEPLKAVKTRKDILDEETKKLRALAAEQQRVIDRITPALTTSNARTLISAVRNLLHKTDLPHLHLIYGLALMDLYQWLMEKNLISSRKLQIEILSRKRTRRKA